MMSLPANDVYVISRDKKEILIPVVPEIIREVDFRMGIVTITPMDGLID
jgi:ribosomal 30S subunit maturation factor RimM